MQKKELPFAVKEIDENDGQSFIIEGILAAYGNVDLGRDRIQPGAFRNFLQKAREKSVPLCWSHKLSEPIGILPIADMQERQDGLYVKGRLPREDTFVSGRVIPQVRIGSVSKMSIGYDVVDATFSGDVRELNELILYEGSLIPVPMNPKADILSFKTAVTFGDLPLAARERAWDRGAAVKRVKEWAGDLVNSSARDKFRKAFLWFDSESPEILSSYKLPIADIIDGVLKAVPRAVFAAAGAVSGARGGVNIPDSDRAGIKAHIEKYYKKLDMDSPFKEKVFRIDDLQLLDLRLIENLLKSGVRFSNNNAKKLVSIFKAAGMCEASHSGVRDETEIEGVLDNILTKIKEVKNV